jgi:hypothetical protein
LFNKSCRRHGEQQQMREVNTKVNITSRKRAVCCIIAGAYFSRSIASTFLTFLNIIFNFNFVSSSTRDDRKENSKLLRCRIETACDLFSVWQTRRKVREKRWTYTRRRSRRRRRTHPGAKKRTCKCMCIESNSIRLYSIYAPSSPAMDSSPASHEGYKKEEEEPLNTFLVGKSF